MAMILEDDTLRVAPTDTSNAFPCIFPTDITNRCYPYPFMIVSAIPIVDSTGTQGPMVAIDPPILSDLPSPGEPNSTLLYMYLARRRPCLADKSDMQ